MKIGSDESLHKINYLYKLNFELYFIRWNQTTMFPDYYQSRNYTLIYKDLFRSVFGFR